MQIFIGYDPRQPIAEAVLRHSIASRSSKPIPITRLQLDQLPIVRRGLTEFTYSRFLVPYLCDYKGMGLFMDADMLCLDDIVHLFEEFNPEHAVQVVKNKQRFEWPSLMLFNCEKCKVLTPEFVDTSDQLFKMTWGDVGELPAEWNYCVGYDPVPNESPMHFTEHINVNIIHYTKGIPVWPETQDCTFAEAWHTERRAMMSTVSFNELMGRSVHVK